MNNTTEKRTVRGYCVKCGRGQWLSVPRDAEESAEAECPDCGRKIRVNLKRRDEE
jgi:DNA-directed RNA polymerase subunit RPC12/RpoP